MHDFGESLGEIISDNLAICMKGQMALENQGKNVRSDFEQIGNFVKVGTFTCNLKIKCCMKLRDHNKEFEMIIKYK